MNWINGKQDPKAFTVHWTRGTKNGVCEKTLQIYKINIEVPATVCKGLQKVRAAEKQY